MYGRGQIESDFGYAHEAAACLRHIEPSRATHLALRRAARQVGVRGELGRRAGGKGRPGQGLVLAFSARHSYVSKARSDDVVVVVG